MGPDDKLAEHGCWTIHSEFETVFLRRPDRHQVVIGDFYGDPECAVIDFDEQWCVVAGCGLIVYRMKKPFRPFEYGVVCDQWSEFGRNKDDIWWVSWLEQTGPSQIRLAVTQDDRHSGLYELNVESMDIRRVPENICQLPDAADG